MTAPSRPRPSEPAEATPILDPALRTPAPGGGTRAGTDRVAKGRRDLRRTRVVVVGGGFGGLGAVNALRRLDVDVTLVDRRNFHLFQPLLYQVATGALSAADIASPFRVVLGGRPGVSVVLGEVEAVEPGERRIRLSDGSDIAYDILVLAPGSTTSYFGQDGWAAVAPGLKSIEDAEDIRRRILLAFEWAEREKDPVARAGWLTFVIVGGGPTGVELAGAIGEIARDVLRRRFRRIDPGGARIVLVEMAPRILASFTPGLARRAVRDLRRLGVEVWTGTKVISVDGEGLTIERARRPERVTSRTVVWAAGVRVEPLVLAAAEALGVSVDAGGRIPVRADLSVPGHPEVFVIGDAADFEAGGRRLPGLAPVAMQQGAHVARVLAARAERRPAPPFRFHDRGNLATIGTGKAIAQLGPLHFDGFPAWLLWLFVHILYLVEFRDRVMVLIQWAWSFFTRGRGSLLITDGRRDRPSPPPAR